MSEEKNVASATISRNAPCPCGSGKKYKLCCGAKAVAAEREAQAKKSPFWTPDGVTAEVDDTRTGWPNDRPKWTMTLPIDEDGDPAEDARCVIEKLVRPYFDRYCELEEGDDVGHREMAIVECFAPFGDPLASSPLVTKGREIQLWDMLLEGLENLLSDCHATRAGREPYQGVPREVWDEGYSYWWNLSEVVCFDQPISCRGNVGMWQMPSALAVKVNAADSLASCAGERIVTV